MQLACGCARRGSLDPGNEPHSLFSRGANADERAPASDRCPHKRAIQAHTTPSGFQVRVSSWSYGDARCTMEIWEDVFLITPHLPCHSQPLRGGSAIRRRGHGEQGTQVERHAPGELNHPSFCRKNPDHVSRRPFTDFKNLSCAFFPPSAHIHRPTVSTLVDA